MGITSEEMNMLEVLFDNKLQPFYLQMNEKFEQVNKHLEENAKKTEARFEQIDKKFEQIDRRFEQIEESIKQIKIQLNKLETRLDCLEKEIAAVRSELEQTKFIIENEVQRNIKIIGTRTEKNCLKVKWKSHTLFHGQIIIYYRRIKIQQRDHAQSAGIDFLFYEAEREETISQTGQDKVEKFCAVVDLKGKLVIVRKELSDKETYLLQGNIAEKVIQFWKLFSGDSCLVFGIAETADKNQLIFFKALTVKPLFFQRNIGKSKIQQIILQRMEQFHRV